MPGLPPDGEPMPADGRLEAAELDRLSDIPFGMYVHVPFCRTRCGYCDFNTYTAAELGGGASRDSYADLAIAEIRFARAVLGAAAPRVDTVFFGGGTPTLLPPGDLAAILRAIDAEFGLVPGAEVTTEANPDSVDQRALGELRAAGFTRMSFGMQSSVSHVLAVLDRSHTPGRAQQCVAWARAEGFDHVSLDLIYGAPGESAGDWLSSVRSALAAEPDHISAYALIVEEGTRLASRIRRGELAAPDDDEMADRYLAADDEFCAAGMGWYEVSNWAADEHSACRHNMLYWTGGNWWGIGPGAHSHVGGTRWWNVRHPAAYAGRIAAGDSPGQAREALTETERRTERIMLTTRLASGCAASELGVTGRRAAATAVHDGLADEAAYGAGRVVLTRRGRLLADAVIRDLTD
ncbi:MAG TPA: radical SAM family heme chaperone HemW [Streptosporangiaceae bacterium]|nr:radical SAM family heme chaperone HemW [Streptosporangiaceae bacterium]